MQQEEEQILDGAVALAAHNLIQLHFLDLLPVLMILRESHELDIVDPFQTHQQGPLLGVQVHVVDDLAQDLQKRL